MVSVGFHVVLTLPYVNANGSVRRILVEDGFNFGARTFAPAPVGAGIIVNGE